MEKVLEAFDSLGDFEIDLSIKRIREKGMTLDGIKIQLVLDVHNDYVNLVTAYPVISK